MLQPLKNLLLPTLVHVICFPVLWDNWAKSYSKNRFPLKLAVSKPVLGGGRVGTWEVLQQYISVLEMNRLKLSFFLFL